MAVQVQWLAARVFAAHSVGEGCKIGAGCQVGGTPESAAPAPWGLTVLAPHCELEAGKRVRPGIMLDRNGEEVSKK